MAYSKKISLKSRIHSINHALKGLFSLLKNEHNSRIHLLAVVIAITLGIILQINYLEWSLIIIVIGLVFLAELLNSALESLSDSVEPGLNDHIRKAKDYAAAAVLIAAFISLIVGGLIFIPILLGLI